MSFAQPQTPPRADETFFAIDSEQELLGSILLDLTQLANVETRASELHYEKHQTIFRALETLFAERKPDDATVTDFPRLVSLLAERGELERVGGASYLVALMQHVASPTFAAGAAERVNRDAQRRALLNASTEIADLAREPGDLASNEIVPRAHELLDKISPARLSEIAAPREYLARFQTQLDAMQRGELRGVETGLDTDRFTNGLSAGDLIVIAGAAGSGKSMLMLTMIANAAMRDAQGLIFSLEMNEAQQVLRLVSQRSGVMQNKMTAKNGLSAMEKRTLDETFAELQKMKLDIVDKAHTLHAIRRQMTRLQNAGRAPRVVGIDYLQLLNDDGDNEFERVKRIARGAKHIARDFECTVLLLHQINRNAVHSDKPALQHLAYGGDYDADVVIICDAPSDEKRGNNDFTAFLHVVKNRMNEIGSLQMVFDAPRARWGNLQIN